MPETVLKGLRVLTDFILIFWGRYLADWETNTMEATFLIPSLSMSKWLRLKARQHGSRVHAFMCGTKVAFYSLKEKKAKCNKKKNSPSRQIRKEV